MKRAGVIGYPLGHSLSPGIFQAAFDAAGIDARYDPWETPPDGLDMRVTSLRADDVLGANVTIPHKETIVPLLDQLEGAADQTGAVNTVVNTDGRLTGHNTDVAGFARALREEVGFDPKGRRAVVLGAGGAARAVALALVEASASVVLVVGRTPRRADRVVADLRPLTHAGTTITWAHTGDGTYLTELPRADLIVNCTPLGTKGGVGEGESPLAAKLLPKDGLVFDVVYNPPETPLLRAARKQGAKAVSGLGMLVYQAAESFRLWTGQEASVDVMMEAGRAALKAGARQ